MDDHEYPFSVTRALVKKYGFKDVEELKAQAQDKFSLVSTKIVEAKSTRLLLVNGTKDGLMPVEDSLLLAEFGTPKEFRMYTGMYHMGYPPANQGVYPWLESIMGVKA